GLAPRQPLPEQLLGPRLLAGAGLERRHGALGRPALLRDLRRRRDRGRRVGHLGPTLEVARAGRAVLAARAPAAGARRGVFRRSEAGIVVGVAVGAADRWAHRGRPGAGRRWPAAAVVRPWRARSGRA